MKSLILIKTTLYILFITCLFAPFTFLKPEVTDGKILSNNSVDKVVNELPSVQLEKTNNVTVAKKADKTDKAIVAKKADKTDKAIVAKKVDKTDKAIVAKKSEQTDKVIVAKKSDQTDKVIVAKKADNTDKVIVAKKAEKTDKVIVVKKVQEKPLHNVKIPDFTKISNIQTKKKKFFDFIKPAVIKQNHALLATREKLNTWLEHISLELPLSDTENQELDELAKRYRVKDISISEKLNTLLMRVDVIPMPLVLVQAANESAWGTSRFSRVGLNFFGIWCYQKGCGMVPSSRNTEAKHEVAAFKSLNEAVTRYFDNINSHKAYRSFRTIRSELRSQDKALSSDALATGLLPYSERGTEYVRDIRNMLRHNKRYFVE
jgi:Bax protein